MKTDPRTWLHSPNGRLRAGWRVLLFLFAAFVAALFAGALSIGVEELARRAGWSLYIDDFVEPVAFLAAHGFMLWRFERAGWNYVFLGRAAFSPRAIVFGALLGTLTIAVPSAVLLSTGDYAFVSGPDGSSTVAALLAGWILLPAAFGEELLMRGYIFSAIRDGLGVVAAVVLTSVVFGVLHAWNPNASVNSVAIVTVSGFFLAAVLLYTRSLYAATAAHFAWNYTIALMHAPISGISILPTPDYRIVERGDDWLTGGTWGPEGGLLATAAVLAATVFLFYRVKANGQRLTANG